MNTFAANAAQSGAEPPASAPSWRIGGLLAQSDIWERYERRFVHPDGRVVDTGNGGASHSEGQGYALLLAVAAGDRPAFDRILDWTVVNLLVRSDGLLAWQADDHNDAADADILVAWALAEAVDYWQEPKYLKMGKLIAHDIAAKLLEPTPRGPLLMPASAGFSAQERLDGPVVNPSYWVFPAFERLRQLAPDADWDGLKASGLDLIESARFGSRGLISDWLAAGGSAPAPATGFPVGFGYNSVRIPLYAFWSGERAPEFSKSFVAAWDDGAFANPSASTASFVEPGYKSLYALAGCAAAATPYPADFYSFNENQNYYPATLSALAIIAAAERGGPCLDPAAMDTALGGTHLAAAADISTLAIPDFIVEASALKPQTEAPSGRTPTKLALASYTGDGAGGPLETILTLAIVLVVAAGGYVLVQRRATRRKQLITTIFTSSSTPASPEERRTPRSLPINPYSGESAPATLELQMENAAAASLEFDKTLGVIFFDARSPAVKKRKRTAQPLPDVTALIAELQGALRASDHVTCLNGYEIIACIALLPGMPELTTIANRLRKIGLSSPAFAEAFQTSPGMAIYPLDGYRGEDLIARARARCGTRQPEARAEPAAATRGRTAKGSA